MYYSYVGIEYVATRFSPARTDLALKLLSSSSVRCRRVNLQTNTPFDLRILAVSADPVSMAGPS
jgi:hypothetical protein